MNNKFAKNINDTGSTAVQIEILNRRVQQISAHLIKFKKDQASKRSLHIMLSKIRKLMKYLYKKDHDSYLDVIKECKIKG